MDQKIAVLGAGSIGSSFAADLTDAGLDVTIVDQWPFVFAPGWVAISLIFSAVIGIGFGIYPAFRAASLQPVEALRTE